MWVGMLSKIKKNHNKFYDAKGDIIGGTEPSSPPPSVKKKTKLKQTVTALMLRRRLKKSSQVTRSKWRRAFKQITKAVAAVETMQNEMKLKKIKGEVEPSPLLIILSEISRRACFVTERNDKGSMLGTKRMKRPGHADHAPVLLNEKGHSAQLSSHKNETQTGSTSAGPAGPTSPTGLAQMFTFSTDVLGHAFKVAVMPVLTKDPDDRSNVEIHAVAHIMRSLHFFTVLEDEALNFLLQTAKLHTLNAGEVLYKRGDEPKMVYCILRGTLSVVVRHMGLNFTACDLYSGTSVGEEAVAANKPQKNTVMATKPTLLLTLPRYPSLLNKMSTKMIAAKIEFLSNISIFNGVTSTESLKQLAEHLNIVRVKNNTAIVKEGQPITHLLLVKSGHLRALKKIPNPTKRRGRHLLCQVQTLAPNDFFGENSFCKMPTNTMRSMRKARQKKRRGSIHKLGSKKYKKQKETETYGTYLASLVSFTYSELYEVPIQTVHAMLSKEAIQSLTTYGNAREQLYETQCITKQVLQSEEIEKDKIVAMQSETNF